MDTPPSYEPSALLFERVHPLLQRVQALVKRRAAGELVDEALGLAGVSVDFPGRGQHGQHQADEHARHKGRGEEEQVKAAGGPVQGHGVSHEGSSSGAWMMACRTARWW